MVRTAPGGRDLVNGRPLVRMLGLGSLAGLLGGLAMVLVGEVLRLAFGIPLLAELMSDRIVPMLPVSDFLRLSARLGGLERAKLISLYGSFALMALGGAAGGALFGALETRTRHAWALLAGALAALGAGLVVFLWPALESNYTGIPPGPARVLAALGIGATLAAYGAVVGPFLRGAVRPATSTREAGPKRAVPEAGPGVKASPDDRPSPRGRRVSRRMVLAGGAGAALALSSGGLAAVLSRRTTVGPNGYDGLQTVGPDIEPITPNDGFYVVTKNIVDPSVVRERWRLEVSGLVERPRTYDFDAFAALPSVEQEQTLQCISNGIGGGLISNAVWRGVPLRTVIDAAGPGPGAGQVVMHAADGYVHTVPFEKAMEPTTILAHRMNGVPLPHRHGFPVRALVPGAFGEVSVKWIDRIEVGTGGVEGYYERQGWMAQFVPTRSRFDLPRNGGSVSLASTPVVGVHGIAFAGDRGISLVEVTTDDGSTWAPARIDYGPSKLTWTLWSFPWRPPAPGRYFLLVRATDGSGEPQTGERRGVAPRGATGYQRIGVRVTS